MSYFLWFVAVIFILETFAMLRAKYALKQLKKDFSKFKNNDEYIEAPRSHATRKMRKFIDTNLPHIEAAGYKFLQEYTKPKGAFINHHVLFTSPSNDSILELSYYKHTPAQRLLFAICCSKYCLRPEIFSICAETNYLNEETVISATIDPAVFPAWVHPTFLALDKSADEVIKVHIGKVTEYEKASNTTAKAVNTMDDYISIQTENRRRLSRRLDTTYDSLVEDNNLEWLVNEGKEEKNI